MVYWKVEFELGEEVAQATAAPRATATPRPAPTSTPRPTPTPKATPTPMPTPTPTRPTGPVTVRVAPDGSGDYPTIQEAVDAVAPGSTIYLNAGTYRLPKLSVTKSLSLLGAGMDLTEIILEQETATFRGEGLFIVEDITFRQQRDSWNVVWVEGGEIAFRRCRFTGGYDGLYLTGNTTGIVQDCEVVGNALNGISMGHYARPTLEGNRCVGNGHDGIIYVENAGGVARNNECSRNEKGILVWDADPYLVDNNCYDNSVQDIEINR